MNNPWLKLSKTPPFVFEEEKHILLDFNDKQDLEHKLFLDMLPLPYLGNVFEAKVVVLQLNPGALVFTGLEDFSKYGNEEIIFPDIFEATHKNLIHEYDDFPFFSINPKFWYSGGFRYWADKIFKPLIKTKDDYHKIANTFCCFELFPYHSKKYRPLNHVLKSQEYTFRLVKEAIKRNCIFLILRKEKEWLKFIPELKNSHYYISKSYLNPTISKKNFPEIFDTIKSLI